MTPIISPWLIYLIDLTNGLSFLISLVVLFSLVVAFLSGASILLDCDKGSLSSTKKCFRISTLLFILSTCLTVVIPSSNTCYKMLVANMITYENIDSAKGLTKEAVDYIFEKIEDLNISNDSQ